MEINIKVLDKNGLYMSQCSLKRAKQMTGRNAAEWVNAETVKMKYDLDDKRRFKEIAMERDNYTCYICQKVMYKGHPNVTADHILARNKGGSDYPENLACCCTTCNFEKGNMDLASFLKRRRGGKKHSAFKTIGLSHRRPTL